MGDGRPSGGGFWRTLPGVLTAVAGLLTAVAALVGALAGAGLLSGGGGGGGPAAVDAAVTLPAAAELAAARIEQGCLGFFGNSPSQCACFGRRVAAALPDDALDAASRHFRAEGRFATAAQQQVADDAELACRSG